MAFFIFLLFIAGPLCSIKQNRLQNDEHLTVLTTKVSDDKNDDLILRTYVYDSCLINNSSTFSNGVKKQELFFLVNGKLVSKKISPMKMRFVNAECTDSLKVLENVIYEIGLIQGNGKILYTIKGAGLCNACPELFAFYNTSGDCLWLKYSNQYKIFKTYGDFESVCKDYGIDPDVWYSNKYKKVKINL